MELFFHQSGTATEELCVERYVYTSDTVLSKWFDFLIFISGSRNSGRRAAPLLHGAGSATVWGWPGGGWIRRNRRVDSWEEGPPWGYGEWFCALAYRLRNFQCCPLDTRVLFSWHGLLVWIVFVAQVLFFELHNRVWCSKQFILAVEWSWCLCCVYSVPLE